MKKTKLISLIALFISVLLIFTSCGFSGCNKINFNDDFSDERPPSHMGNIPMQPPMEPPAIPPIEDSTSNTDDNTVETEHSHFLVKESTEPSTYESEGRVVYKCSFCDYEEYEAIPRLEHSFSTTLSYDENNHWYACLDKGYDTLKSGESEHSFSVKSVSSATYESEEITEYLCTCGYAKFEITSGKLEHNYSSTFSYDDTHHWYSCVDIGYEELRAGEAMHTDSNEVILQATTDTTAGRARYTCSECGHTYEKTIYLKTEITASPVASNNTVYIGQPLSSISLIGDEGSVEGVFNWSNPNEIITTSGQYSVTFTPTQSDVYETLYTTVYVTATQLTITLNIGENGTASQSGTINVNYGEDVTVAFSANNGYEISEVLLDGISQANLNEITLENVTSNHTVSVTFTEIIVEELPFIITYVSGTDNAYTFDGTTLTFTEVSEDTVYSITGELNGNIVFDVVNDYKVELEMCGFTLSCDTTNPITILSGGEVSLKAKNSYQNYIYDNRDAIDTTNEALYSATVYSLVDLELSGKGSLTIVSKNNNGVHTKDDLQVKKLTLLITCVDNALKGNDGVEITNANTTLISTQGDCIKTTNSHINENTLNQKGTISITGGTHNLYSACDAIDSSYNVVIDDSTTVLNIYTDKYSEYSEEITTVSESTYYLRYTSNSYKYAVRYYNSTTGEYEWVNVSSDYETVTSSSNRPGGSGSTYYYYTFAKLSGYDKLAVYMYTSEQEQGQDTSYYACSSDKTVNESYDTIALSYRNSSLSVNWTNYSTSSTGGMGGMQEGNSDKGTYSTKGIKSANEIVINEGIITIQAYDDAIHANNDGGTLENGESPTGNVTINGGVITIYSNDDGVHADGTLLITNGTLDVTNAYEGLEGLFIIIKGGNVSVNSSDDGFNGTSTSGAAIEISGGKVYVYATGDGIDSNSTTSKGAILFSGGDTVVICNSNGNSAIDSDGGYTHTGGRVVAIMSSGGMTSETTNGNTLGMTKKSSLSLSTGSCLNVTVDGSTALDVKMPCSLTAYVVYIGSSSASITSSTTSTNTLDEDGVYWSE